MADVASGNRRGFSVARLKADKAEYQEMLSGLNSGTVRPRDVVGTGGTKKMALAWLTKRIDELDVALKHRGIMDSINLGNYNILLREVLKGSDSGMVPDGIESDREFIQSAIDGKADFYDKAVTDRLAELAKQYTDGDMAALLKQAKTAAKNFFMTEFQKKTA